MKNHRIKRDVELLSFLESVTARVVRHYRQDFEYDRAKLRDAVSEHDMENRVFYWMARPSGTWCVLERSAFLKETSAHAIWTHYLYMNPNEIEAYRIVVESLRDGRLFGSVIKLEYPAQAKRVEQNALPTKEIELRLRSGRMTTIPYAEFQARREPFAYELDSTCRVRYCPESEAELRKVIWMEHRYQKGWKPKKHSIGQTGGDERGRR